MRLRATGDIVRFAGIETAFDLCVFSSVLVEQLQSAHGLRLRSFFLPVRLLLLAVDDTAYAAAVVAIAGLPHPMPQCLAMHLQSVIAGQGLGSQCRAEVGIALLHPPPTPAHEWSPCNAPFERRTQFLCAAPSRRPRDSAPNRFVCR